MLGPVSGLGWATGSISLCSGRFAAGASEEKQRVNITSPLAPLLRKRITRGGGGGGLCSWEEAVRELPSLPGEGLGRTAPELGSLSRGAGWAVH